MYMNMRMAYIYIYVYEDDLLYMIKMTAHYELKAQV